MRLREQMAGHMTGPVARHMAGPGFRATIKKTFESQPGYDWARGVPWVSSPWLSSTRFPKLVLKFVLKSNHAAKPRGKTNRFVPLNCQ